MLPFFRRDLQRDLALMSAKLGSGAVQPMVERLNKPGRQRLATAWEVAVLAGFCRIGAIQHEKRLVSGKKPDLWFERAPGQKSAFIADVTTVSDDDAHDNAAVDYFCDVFNKAADRIGATGAGFHIQIRAFAPIPGQKVRLKLPPKNDISRFIKTRVLPFVREVKQSASARQIHIHDGDVDITISFSPRSRGFGHGHAMYTLPATKKNNSLYNKLNAKADQLAGDPACIRGVFIANAGCDLLSKADEPGALSARSVVEEFFRERNSLDFVALLDVQEFANSPRWPYPTRRRVGARWYAPDKERLAPVRSLLEAALAQMSEPACNASTAYATMNTSGYGVGGWGGYSMDGETITISLRSLQRLLAGEVSASDFQEAHGWNDRSNYFALRLHEGRLIDRMEITRGKSDDFVSIHFGPEDASISRFKAEGSGSE